MREAPKHMSRVRRGTLRTMVSILNVTDTPKQAFARGFWKGMAAPLILFSAFDLPAQAKPLDFQPLPTRKTPSIGSSWVRVGNLLRASADQDRLAQREQV